jgi:NAD-dependent dihydropyrimidine dehydrogenase PreA subunit
MNGNGKSLIKQSTRDLYREGKRTEDYSLFDFLHGYLYSRWPYLYIGVATGEHGLTRVLKPIFLFLSNILTPSDKNYTGGNGDAYADSYHGKVVPVQEAKNLVSIQEDIVIKDLETVIPYTQAKDIILKNPDKIAALVCPCRSSRAEPCYPLDVCIIVGDPFVSFVLEHTPDKARLISSEEAMEILQEEHERGHVHHAFFKDAMLNRFYAICNCCACCCGAFQAHQFGSPMLASSGYSALVNTQLCKGCGTCRDHCQFSAIEINNKIANMNREACFGCGVFVDVCENNAISLNLDPDRGIPLEINKLINEAQLAN